METACCHKIEQFSEFIETRKWAKDVHGFDDVCVPKSRETLENSKKYVLNYLRMSQIKLESKSFQ